MSYSLNSQTIIPLSGCAQTTWNYKTWFQSSCTENSDARTEENQYLTAEQKFRLETPWTDKIVQVTFLSGRNRFSRCFLEKMSVLRCIFFFMLEKFHACVAAKKWLLFMPHGENKNMGNLLVSHLYLDEEMFTLLFKALVRPHLEYAQFVWNQYLNGGVASTTWYPATVLMFVFAHVLAYVSARFAQIYQLLHKLLSINIILKSIKGHNSVEKFGKIICISHNMDHIYQCINKILSKSIHYF